MTRVGSDVRELAVFIVNYNGLANLGNLLFKALESLLNSASGAAGVDVWFVDNASTDGSVEAVREEFRDLLRYVVLRKNLGYGAAFNLAYRRTLKEGLKYRFYACSNNDIVVYGDALKELLKWLHALSKVFPHGFIAAPILKGGDSGELDSGSHYADPSAKTWSLTLALRSPATLKKVMRRTPLPVSYADGAFMVFHHKLMGKSGPFNPKYFLYHEDVEVSFRAWSSGIPSLLIPVELGKHYRSSSAGRMKPLQTYTQVRNRVYTACRYVGPKTIPEIMLWYLRALTLGTALSVTYGAGGSRERPYPIRTITRGLIDALRWALSEGLGVAGRQVPLLNIPLSKAVSRKTLLSIVQRRLKELLKYHATLVRTNTSP